MEISTIMTATVTVVSTTEATSKLATTAKSASELWMVEGSYYDLEEFVARHPGGELPLSQTQGQDITPLFYSHHLNEFPSRVLKKYAVAKPTDGTFIKPHGYSFEENGFFMTLKRRIAALGLENGRKVWDYKRYAVSLDTKGVGCCLFALFHPRTHFMELVAENELN